MGPHAPYIIASYLLVVGTVGVLIAWLIADGRVIASRIKDLESRGIRRRSVDGT